LLHYTHTNTSTLTNLSTPLNNGTTLGGGANHVLWRKLMGVFVRVGERMHYVATFQTVFLGRLGGFGPVMPLRCPNGL